MKTILIILTCLILTNCATQKLCNQKFPPKTETITELIEKIKIDTLLIPNDTLFMDFDAPCNDFEIMAENNALRAEIKAVKGKVITKVVQKRDTVFLPSKEVVRTEIVTKIETVKECPKVTKFFSWIGAGLILLIVLYFVAKFKKLI